jgi:hypothetical protein
LVEPRSSTKVEATRKNSPNKVKQEKIFKDQPATPILRLKRVHTSKDVASDSDDSDVVVVNDPMNASNDKARVIQAYLGLPAINMSFRPRTNEFESKAL